MKLFHRVSLEVRAFFRTLSRAERDGEDGIETTVDLIQRLAEARGMDTSVSKMMVFSDEDLAAVPREGGVCHIYEGGTLRYIGVSNYNPRKRLRRHLTESRRRPCDKRTLL